MNVRHIIRRVFKLRYVPRLLCLKIKYGHRLKLSFEQRKWERGLEMHIEKRGRAEIGSNNNYRAGFAIRLLNDANLKIGDNVFVNRNVSITSLQSITIGNNVKIANNVVIVDHDHDYLNKNAGYIMSPVVIEDNVWIGANAVILRGVHVGQGAVIAAGSVVNTGIPPFTVFGGVPAKLIKQYKC